MSSTHNIFLVDDQIGDSRWLVDLLERGLRYKVHQETNEEAARRELEEIAKGKASYVLAIFDIMVSTKDIMDLVNLDDAFYAQSRDTGIRLCRYAREELGISAEQLPIVCLSARDDEEVVEALRRLEIQLFSRTPQTPEDSIRIYLKKNLPKIE